MKPKTNLIEPEPEKSKENELLVAEPEVNCKKTANDEKPVVEPKSVAEKEELLNLRPQVVVRTTHCVCGVPLSESCPVCTASLAWQSAPTTTTPTVLPTRTDTGSTTDIKAFVAAKNEANEAKNKQFHARKTSEAKQILDNPEERISEMCDPDQKSDEPSEIISDKRANQKFVYVNNKKVLVDNQVEKLNEEFVECSLLGQTDQTLINQNVKAEMEDLNVADNQASIAAAQPETGEVTFTRTHKLWPGIITVVLYPLVHTLRSVYNSTCASFCQCCLFAGVADAVEDDSKEATTDNPESRQSAKTSETADRRLETVATKNKSELNMNETKTTRKTDKQKNKIQKFNPNDLDALRKDFAVAQGVSFDKKPEQSKTDLTLQDKDPVDNSHLNYLGKEEKADVQDEVTEPVKQERKHNRGRQGEDSVYEVVGVARQEAEPPAARNSQYSIVTQQC